MRIMFRLASLLVLALAVCQAYGLSIYETAKATDALSTLAAVLDNPDYESIKNLLDAPGNYTVFAPNNKAFEDAALDLTQVDLVTATLTYHVLGSVVPSSALAEGLQEAASLATAAAYVTLGGAGQNLKITLDAGAVTVNDATVVAANVITGNGIVHIVDTVISLPVLTSTTATNAGLTKLVAAVVANSLVDAVDTTASVTIFAPVDAAFDGLSALSAPTLQYHIVPSVAFSNDLSDGQVLTTLQDYKLTVTITDGAVYVNGAKVVTPNVLTRNGVVHVIDRVLFENIVAAATTTNALSALAGVVGNSDYSNIATALSAKDATLTLFAPNNDAINGAGLPVDSNIPLVSETLLYHVLGSEVASTDLVEGVQEAVSLATATEYVTLKDQVGQNLVITVDAGGVSLNGEATVVAANIITGNGIVHVVDGVISLPLKTSETASNANLTALVNAVVQTNLTQTIDETPSLTIFAPENAAFKDFVTGDLADVLKYHVVPGVVFSNDLENGEVQTLLANEKVDIKIENGDVFVNDAKVILPNVLTKNGVVHVIANVLDPNQSSATAVSVTVSLLAACLLFVLA